MQRSEGESLSQRCDIRTKRCIRVVGVMLVAAGLTGCWQGSDGRASRVTVTGSVSCDGRPVEGARVVLYPLAEGLPAAHGTTDSAGSFRLTTYDPGDGAVPGSYVALVTKTQSENEMSPEEGDAYFARTGTPPPFPTVRNLLPARYGDHESSGLVCEVVAGQKNDLKLTLSAD